MKIFLLLDVREHFSGCTSDTVERVKGKISYFFLNGKKYFFCNNVYKYENMYCFTKKNQPKRKYEENYLQRKFFTIT